MKPSTISIRISIELPMISTRKHVSLPLMQKKLNVNLHTVLILILLLKKCFNTGSAAWYSSKEFSYCCLYIPQIQYRSGIQLGFPRDLNSCKLNTMQTILNFPPASTNIHTFSYSPKYCPQGVTKRCRLSLLTNSALVIWVQMREEGGNAGVSAIEYCCSHHVKWSLK